MSEDKINIDLSRMSYTWMVIQELADNTENNLLKWFEEEGMKQFIEWQDKHYDKRQTN